MININYIIVFISIETVLDFIKNALSVTTTLRGGLCVVDTSDSHNLVILGGWRGIRHDEMYSGICLWQDF